MNKEDIFFKIEAWLDGALPPDVARDFEKEITENPHLKHEVEQRQLERKVIDRIYGQDLRKKMQTWEIPPTGTSRFQTYRFGRNKLWLLIISLTVVALYCGYLLTKSSKRSTEKQILATPEISPKNDESPINQHVDTFQSKQDASSNRAFDNSISNQKLTKSKYVAVAKLYHVRIESSNLRGMGNNTNLLKPAKDAYHKNDFRKAVELIHNLPKEIKESNSARELLGHIFFENEDYRAASEEFEMLVKSGDLEFLESAKWNRLLCFVALCPLEKVKMQELLSEFEAKSQNAELLKLKIEILKIETSSN